MMAMRFGIPIMSASRKVAFRADATHEIGVGHFARCSSLMSQLNSTPDVDVLLITTVASKPFINQFFEPALDSLIVQDIATPAEILSQLKRTHQLPNAMVLDGYQMVPEWEVAARHYEVPLIAFDDLGLAKDADDVEKLMGELDTLLNQISGEEA